MYSILKSQIINGNYDLNSVLARISKFYAYGQLTEEQYDELIALAYQNVSVDALKADQDTLIASLQAKVLELEERIKMLEAKTSSGLVSDPDPVTDQNNEIQEWEAWNGITQPPGYQTGNKVMKDGKIWESQVDNNIWIPGAPGIFDNIWKEVEE